jgi:AraC-like DNA-binding protein
MSQTVRTFPPTADPLAEALDLLRLNGTLFCRSELSAPWGIELPPIEGCMMLHLMTAGRCWLLVEGEAPRLLQQGSLALVPRDRGHRMVSALDADAEPLFDIPVERLSERYEILRHGGGGESAQAICVVVRYDPVAAEHLLKFLPGVIQVDAWEDDAGGWLQNTLRFIAREAKDLRPGGETVITRLADVLIIQTIRSWVESAQDSTVGWLAAMRDEQVGQALIAVHREPQRAWTVELMAREAGMSRSAFSARFTDLVGDTALRFLTQWRMRLAHIRLRSTTDPLFAVAEGVGYESEASFCRAFKRVFGVAPGSVRRTTP